MRSLSILLRIGLGVALATLATPLATPLEWKRSQNSTFRSFFRIMGRKKDIKDFCRGQISAYAKTNLSHADIARRLKISRDP